jgi:hypothetical protein
VTKPVTVYSHNFVRIALQSAAKTTSRGRDWGAFCFLSKFPLHKVNDKNTTKSFLFLQKLGKSLILGHYFLSKFGENFRIVYLSGYYKK